MAKPKKPKVYAFKLVIQQEEESAAAGNAFGSIESWAHLIKVRMERNLLFPKVVSVTPIRNRKAKA